MNAKSRRPGEGTGSERQISKTDVWSLTQSFSEKREPGRILATHWFRADELAEAV